MGGQDAEGGPLNPKREASVLATARGVARTARAVLARDIFGPEISRATVSSAISRYVDGDAKGEAEKKNDIRYINNGLHLLHEGMKLPASFYSTLHRVGSLIQYCRTHPEETNTLRMDRVAAFVEESIPDIYRNLSQSPENLSEALDDLCMMLSLKELDEDAKGTIGRIVKMAVDSSVTKIEDAEEKKSVMNKSDAVQFELGSELELKKSLKQLEQHVWASPETAVGQLTMYLESPLVHLQKEAKLILSRILKRVGLSEEKTLETWERTSGGGRTYPIRENIERIVRLEQKYPGAVKELNKMFGIECFGRYPLELLIRQFEEKDDQSKPYGVLLFAKTDHNASMYREASVLDQMYKQIEGTHSMRVIECKSKLDIAKKLIQSKDRYGDAHKIGFAYINGHASPEGVAFGDDFKRDALTVQDLKGLGVQRSGTFFDSDATVIINGCQSGARGGIGQKLSGALGLEVIAPEQAVLSIGSITAQKDPDNHLKFSVEYTDVFRNVDTKRYRQGEEITVGDEQQAA